MDQWYFQRQGQRYGPCTLDKLKRVAAAGKIDATDLVHCPGMYEWVPATNVPELAAVFAPPPAPPQPAPPAPAPLPEPQKAIIPTPPPAPAVLSPVEPPKDTPAAPRRSGGFLSSLQGRVPKPVLFGLYGALGALLGLLLLGELLFALLHPPKLKPEVKVAVASELVVFPGSENKLTVTIARHGFQGPVTISAANLTRDIQIPDVTIPEGSSDADLNVKASADVEPRSSYVQLNVTAEGVAPASGGFQLNVTSVPPTLQAALPPAVAVFTGYTNRFPVKIARERFEG